MQIKEYLKNLKCLKKEIDIYRKMIENLQLGLNDASGIDYSKPRVQCSPENSVEEAGWKLLEEKSRLTKKIQDCVKRRHEIMTRVNEIGDVDMIRILLMRYDDGLNFQQIAIKLQYSYSVVTHMHGDALKKYRQF